MSVSLFASSIRMNLWPAFFRSMEGTTVPVEVVFAGPREPVPVPDVHNVTFCYIKTKNIKPAQIYEVARRTCTQELILWTADDAEFPNDVLGEAYRFWKANCTRKDVLCIRTRENYGTWRDCDNTKHHFFGNTPESPKMAPIGMMNREYLAELGGIDRRYICGQWDNSTMMQVYNDGGSLFYFGDRYIELDHVNKHDPDCGITFERPFGKGYYHDRKILEGSWGKKGQMVYSLPYRRFDNGFEPFEEEGITERSQSFNIPEVFCD